MIWNTVNGKFFCLKLIFLLSQVGRFSFGKEHEHPISKNDISQFLLSQNLIFRCNLIFGRMVTIVRIFLINNKQCIDVQYIYNGSPASYLEHYWVKVILK